MYVQAESGRGIPCNTRWEMRLRSMHTYGIQKVDLACCDRKLENKLDAKPHYVNLNQREYESAPKVPTCAFSQVTVHLI